MPLELDSNAHIALYDDDDNSSTNFTMFDSDPIFSAFSMSYNYLMVPDSLNSSIVQGIGSLSLSSVCIGYEFVMYSLIGGFMCLAGTVGNCLSFIIFWPDRRKSSTMFLVLSLTVVDTSVLLAWTTVPGVVAWARYTRTLPAIRNVLPYAQVYIYPLCTLTHMVTTWVTVLVALHRYVAVCQPHDIERYGSLRLARVQFVLLLVLSTAFNVPRFLEHHTDRVSVDNGTTWLTVTVRRSIAKDDLYETLYLVGAYQVVIYVIPLVLLVLFTHRLLRALKIARARREEMMTVNNLRLHADFTLSLVIVVIIFLVCQLFNPIRRILVAVATTFSTDDGASDLRQSAHERCGSFYFYFAPVVVLMVDLNSSVNFFVYFVCGRRFRAKVLRLVGCQRPATNAVRPIIVVAERQT